jgi:hypothetical protein
MTREEHIKKAEDLLAGTWHPAVYAGNPPKWRQPTEYALATAQVHATLAVAMSAAAKPVEPMAGVDELRPTRSWLRQVMSR